MRVDGLSSDGQPGGDLAPAYRPGVDVAKLVAMFGVVATHVVGYGLRPAPDAAHPAAKVHFHDFTSPCVIGIAILAFALCQKIPARAGKGGALRALAAATLGVYLIHVQPCFWSRVFVPRMGALAASSAWDWLARGLGLSFAVFAACLALDLLRARLFALLRLDALCDGLCARVAALVKGTAAP